MYIKEIEKVLNELIPTDEKEFITFTLGYLMAMNSDKPTPEVKRLFKVFINIGSMVVSGRVKERIDAFILDENNGESDARDQDPVMEAPPESH